MKTPFADAEIPLSEIPKARARRNEFIAECRRYQIAVSDPNRKRQAPWKIRDHAKPLPPAWEFERDKTGKITLARQLRRLPGGLDNDPKFTSRKFIAVIEGDPCCVGGEHVEHGTKVECYAGAAFDIHGHRGKITEEFQE